MKHLHCDASPLAHPHCLRRGAQDSCLSAAVDACVCRSAVCEYVMVVCTVCSTLLGCYGHGSCTTSAVSGRLRVRPGPGSSWQWAAAARSQSQSWASCGSGPASPGLKSRGSGSEAPAWPWMSSGSTNLSAHFKGCNLWLKCHILGHTGGGDERLLRGFLFV